MYLTLGEATSSWRPVEKLQEDIMQENQQRKVSTCWIVEANFAKGCERIL